MAPHFGGLDSKLATYFEDLKQLFKDHNVMDVDNRKKLVYRYTKRAKAEAWKVIEDINKLTWDEFKNAVADKYPDANLTPSATQADLEKLVVKQGKEANVTSQSFGTFYRTFNTIACQLKAKNKLTDFDCNTKFLSAFAGEFKEELVGRLKLKLPDQDPNEPYPLADVKAAALYLLKARASYSTKLSSVVQVKWEDTEQQVQDLVNKRMAELNMQQAYQTSDRHNAEPRLYNYRAERDSRPQECFYCGAPGCTISTCKQVKKDYNTGMIGWSNGCIAMADGLEIPQYVRGRYLKERIEDALRRGGPRYSPMPGGLPTQRNQPPHIQTNLVKVAKPESFRACAGDRIENDLILVALNQALKELEPKDEYRQEVLETEAEQRRKKVKFDGVELTRKYLKANNKLPLQVGPPTGKQKAAEASTLKQPAQKDGPQFRYHSAVEDRGDAKDLAERLLRQEITIQGEELYAVALAVRSAMKDVLAAKQVPPAANNYLGAETYLTGKEDVRDSRTTPAQGDIVSKKVEDLRLIYPKLGTTGIIAECVLNNSLQVVAIHKDVWMRLGGPLIKTEQMQLGLSNSTTLHTLGMIPNLRINIGGLDLFVQAQVVDHAPYKVLLGRPFTCLAQATTQDYLDGLQTVSLECPNTNKHVKVPTFERTPKGCVEVGFWKSRI
jgi:hypothetical protein